MAIATTLHGARFTVRSSVRAHSAARFCDLPSGDRRQPWSSGMIYKYRMNGLMYRLSAQLWPCLYSLGWPTLPLRRLLVLHKDNVECLWKRKMIRGTDYPVYLQMHWSGTQDVQSPCIVRIQHAQDCSQSTSTFISLTLPHSFPLNMSQPVDHDAIGIPESLYYNSHVASLSDNVSH